ncbi:helix-turn-helix transcriptional regulator [Sedimenticola selenatireducens]|nr:helix-turn-helix transcriptional regulator [Sedimenticola selenatireducens]
MAAVMSQHSDVFMSVKQVAEYLHLNEKKIYALVNEGGIPATKVTGKWMFPRELVDRWMLDSTHGGLLTDRLVISGGGDPLLYRLIQDFARQTGAHALISYTPTGTRLGLDLLQANRVDACGVHWGPDSESHLRHPALLSQYSQHHQWVLIRAFRREQGLMISPEINIKSSDVDLLFHNRYRWATRQTGSGSQRFLLELLSHYSISKDELNNQVSALSAREAAAAIAMKQCDVAPGARAIAKEYGLGFITFGWESFDIALPRNIWFRRLFQDLITRLKSQPCQSMAERLTGYNLEGAGDLVWGDD